ncbi:uncharacterized protein I303_102640 [Kwoniella dejecticola CBS 10117]|uniref:Aminoglycoside phosphotransferase domain-containing protein n=1 Tax=Kwoniella dejecticola CBS 10117 TaxID=1296121 RepID=A0AAJ8KMA4_9TREE
MSFRNCCIPNCIYEGLVSDKSKNEKGKCISFGWETWYEPEISQIIQLLDPVLIKAEVESLRPGYKVSKIDIPTSSKRFSAEFQGSCNFHVKINFKEQAEPWIMRIRRRAAHRYPDQPLTINMASEVATIRALRSGDLDVPDAYLRPKDSQLHPKLIYCYQTWVPGDMWRPFYGRDAKSLPLDTTSLHHVECVAQWFITMEKVKFDMVGSLAHSDDEREAMIHVGPLIERHPAFTTPPYFQGPFRTAKNRWVASIDKRLERILAGVECQPRTEIVLYLIYLEAKQLVEGCAELEDIGPFYIKHDDDRFDHIRANPDGEVTGILDWEWAYTTNEAEAFAAPSGWVSEDYRAGSNDTLSPREMALIEAYIKDGRSDLADYVKSGRKYHRLVDLLRYDDPSVIRFNALERAFLDLPDSHTEQSNTVEEWVAIRKEKYKDDEDWKNLLKLLLFK